MLQLIVLFPIFSAFLSIAFKRLSYSFALLSGILTTSITLFLSIDIGGNDVLAFHSSSFINLKIDQLSCVFILLTAFLTLVCTANSGCKGSGYISLLLFLQSIVTLVFCATDLLTFYIFFELSLVPLFFIIGLWGSKERVYAAYKFFLYTLCGSVGFLLAMLFIYAEFGTLQIAELYTKLQFLDFNAKKVLWIAFFLAFAVKIPMPPFHTWLPDAHVQAPTSGSMMLAGILIKLGGYGFLKILIPLLPDASVYFAPMVLTLSAIAVVYISVVAIMQEDMKKLIAYSSIAHMGIVTAGIFSFELEGVRGALFQMVSHGLISAALFLCVGCLYERLKTRKISEYKGLANVMPVFAFFFIFFSMASIGLPGTSGFVGEFLVGIGLFASHQVFAIICTMGVILSACYMLFLCKRTIWGVNQLNLKDLSCTECISLFALLFSVLFLGLFPGFILKIS